MILSNNLKIIIIINDLKINKEPSVISERADIDALFLILRNGRYQHNILIIHLILSNPNTQYELICYNQPVAL